MGERLSILGGLALLAVAFVIGSVAIGHGIRDKNKNDVISVTGSAKKRIQSDYIVWNLAVTSQQPSAPAAARELAGPSSARERASSSGVMSPALTATSARTSHRPR